MKSVRIWFTDFEKSWDPKDNFIIRRLKKKFNIVMDAENPDFLFCGPFGKEFFRYKCVRIFYTGEAITPDFNVYDYAIGFDHIDFGDRYLCYPLCLINEDTLKKVRNKHLRDDSDILERKKFCNLQKILFVFIF